MGERKKTKNITKHKKSIYMDIEKIHFITKHFTSKAYAQSSLTSHRTNLHLFFYLFPFIHIPTRLRIPKCLTGIDNTPKNKKITIVNWITYQCLIAFRGSNLPRILFQIEVEREIENDRDLFGSG